MKSESLKRAQKKYRSKFSRVEILLPKELMEQVKSVSTASGISVSAFIVDAINASLSKTPEESHEKKSQSGENPDRV